VHANVVILQHAAEHGFVGAQVRPGSHLNEPVQERSKVVVHAIVDEQHAAVTHGDPPPGQVVPKPMNTVPAGHPAPAPAAFVQAKVVELQHAPMFEHCPAEHVVPEPTHDRVLATVHWRC